jgi:acyl-homoserine-lactone acylase
MIIFLPKLGRTVLLLVLLSCCYFFVSAQNPKSEILWDDYGVPHIYAKNTTEMYYAFGWAQMNNHANLLLHIYGQARGRAAEYWGSEYVESDKQVLVFDLPEKGKEMYRAQSSEYKNYLDAFVKGINDYAKSHPGSISAAEKPVLPVTGGDVCATILRTMFRFLTANERAATQKLFQAGSNAYAVGASRTASHKAMLVIDPHLPWKKDFTLLFEAHLQSNECNEYGVGFVGMPVLLLAFNNNLGWTHTVNTFDASDSYELKLKDGGYVLDGKVLPFDRKTYILKTKQTNGSLTEEKLEVKISKHGPVLGEKNDNAYAVRVAGLSNARLFEQYHRMGKAKSWKEFESALKMMQIPMFNLLYSDKAGNIFYLFNGNLPKRPEGDFAYWRGTIDGTRSDLIWNEKHGYEDLPKVFNPPGGFLQNANEPPWNCTSPAVLDPQNFPAYFAPQNMPLRPQRAMNMIRNNFSISFDELTGYKLNTEPEAASRFLDDLYKATDKYPDSIAKKAVTILRAWNKQTDANSKGAVLFSNWFDKLTPADYAKKWNRLEPFSTPDGLADERLAVELLAKSAKETEEKYGSMDVAWGDVYRIRMNDVDLPSNGGWQQQGIFMSMSYVQDTDKKFRVEGGETFIGVVEFKENTNALVLLPYGNASEKNSRHQTDQLKLFSEKKLRRALLTKEAILSHLEKREILNPQL